LQRTFEYIGFDVECKTFFEEGRKDVKSIDRDYKRHGNLQAGKVLERKEAPDGVDCVDILLPSHSDLALTMEQRIKRRLL
jgi:hypothetical protein